MTVWSMVNGTIKGQKVSNVSETTDFVLGKADKLYKLCKCIVNVRSFKQNNKWCMPWLRCNASFSRQPKWPK